MCGLVQWIIIIVLIAVILFGFAAVIDFSKGVIKKVYPTPIITGNVVRVIDGDTFDLDTGQRIRLALVNTPERNEYGYQAAKEWLEYRCLGKHAVIDLDSGQKAGSYGRVIGLVYCDDNYFVNLEIIELRLGVVMTNYCKVSEFKDNIICSHQLSK